MLELFEHQKKAINRLKNGNILCGNVGSGKSLTALAYFYFKVCKGEINIDGGTGESWSPKDLYIITTAKKRDSGDWSSEILNIPELAINVKAVIDSWNNIKKYAEINNAFFIFDEQRVVGTGTWVKSFLKIAKNNKWILLSATPGDSWVDYIPVFLANGFYNNRTQFIQEHVIYNRSVTFPLIQRYINVDKLEMLKKRILVTMEFKRSTVSKYELIECLYDKKLLEKIFIKRWNIYSNEPITNISSVYYLSRRLMYEDISRINEIYNLYNKHKRLIIFYNYNYELTLLRESLSRHSIIFAEWNGHKHEDVPTGKEWIYLVQYTAGAEGWECISCNTIVFYSLNYSYKLMAQASGRINRLNTPYSYLYYYALYCNNKIDSAILKCIKEKKDFNEREASNFLHALL